MTNEEILNLNKGLEDLSKLNLALNIRVSYNLAKIKAILKPLVSIIQEKQMDLYKRWGEPAEQNSIKVPTEKIPNLEKDLKELYEIDNEVNLSKVKVGDFGDVEIPIEVIEELISIIEE